MSSSPPIGAMSAGLRYQVRFFWRHALAMLFPKRTVAKVVVEHRGVGAVDDVVVYYIPPGVNERGATIDVDFFQLKFHTAKTGAVDHGAVVDPNWTGTKLPMLARFASAWNEIRADHPSARLSLVTNWPWDPRSPLAPLIRDGGRLSGDFFDAGKRSAVGKIRAEWQAACELGELEFRQFVAALRFSASAVSQDDSESWLRDRCQLAGLVPIGIGIDHSPYDDLGARLIESGRTEHTPESLRALVEKQGLVEKEAPYRSTFAVRSFTRFAHVAETDGQCVVDLTDLFDGRNAHSDDAWTSTIPARLNAAIPKVERLGQPVHVALDAHLSIAWYAGHMLDPKSGVHVVLRQKIKTKGIELWDVATPRRPDLADDWEITAHDGNADGRDIAVAISVTQPTLTDAQRHVREHLPGVGIVVHAALPALGPQAIQNGPHARWLADSLVRLLGSRLAELRPSHVHVFPACPASLAFLLGQEARALGPTTVYEYDFGGAGRSYRPGMTIITEPRT